MAEHLGYVMEDRLGYEVASLPAEMVTRLLWGPDLFAAIHSRANGYQFIADGIGESYVMEQVMARKEAAASASALRSLAEEIAAVLDQEGTGEEQDPWPLKSEVENVRIFSRVAGKHEPARDRFGVLRR